MLCSSRRMSKSTIDSSFVVGHDAELGHVLRSFGFIYCNLKTVNKPLYILRKVTFFLIIDSFLHPEFF